MVEVAMVMAEMAVEEMATAAVGRVVAEAEMVMGAEATEMAVEEMAMVEGATEAVVRVAVEVEAHRKH